MILGNGENGRDRTDLSNGYETASVATPHQIARIYLAKPNAPANGSDDAGIGEIEFCIVQECLIAFDHAVVLSGGGFLRGHGLLRNRIPLPEAFKAHKVEVGIPA